MAERSTSRQKRKLNKPQKKKASFGRWIVPIFTWLAGLLMVLQIYTLGVLPPAYFGMVAAILLLLCLLITAFRKSNASVVLGCLYFIALAAGIFYVAKANGMIDAVTKPEAHYTNVNVYVNKEDPAQELADIAGYRVGIMAEIDRSNTDLAIAEIEEALGSELPLEEFESIDTLVAAVHSGEVDAILVNEAYTYIYDDNTESAGNSEATVEASLRILYTAEVKAGEGNGSGGAAAPAVLEANKSITTAPFVIYLSGSDTRAASLGMNDRSDVNILAVVNPVTKNVLLVSTPRDYYIPLSVSNGNRDKLTHAGVQGIQCSMDTLANLYGIEEVRYYAKINFVGFENIVDALGGVTVWSDYSFTTYHGGYYIQQGWNNLNGAKTLSFVRERYAFADGDFQRGRNQMYALQAIFSKVKSPAILTGYNNLLNAISGCFATNMPREDIESLVQMQLNDAAEWQITSVSAAGTTGPAVCWQGGSSPLSVVFPDENSVAQISQQIRQAMTGETIVASEPASSASDVPDSTALPSDSSTALPAAVPGHGTMASLQIIKTAISVAFVLVLLLTILLLIHQVKSPKKSRKIRRK